MTNADDPTMDPTIIHGMLEEALRVLAYGGASGAILARHARRELEELRRRAPLSCGEPRPGLYAAVKEDRDAMSAMIERLVPESVRERDGTLQNVERWLSEHLTPGSAPVADAEEGSAASIVEQCAKVCDDRAAYVQTIVDEIESGVRSQARFGHLDALRSQLSVLRTTARKIRLLAPPTPPPARPFPTEEECRRAFADVATVLPGSKGTGAGIAAVRSLCLAALPAQTTSGTESDHLADASKMVPAAAPEPERETDVHTLTGNCRASAAVWIGDACNGGEYCDRCHEHDSPRGKCATCDRCACCDALFVKIMRVEDVDAAIAKRDRDLGAASPLPQSPQGGKPTNAN